MEAVSPRFDAKSGTAVGGALVVLCAVAAMTLPARAHDLLGQVHVVGTRGEGTAVRALRLQLLALRCLLRDAPLPAGLLRELLPAASADASSPPVFALAPPPVTDAAEAAESAAREVATRMGSRMEELQAVEASCDPTLLLRCALELRALQAVPLQRRVRAALANESRRAASLGATAEPLMFRCDVLEGPKLREEEELQVSQRRFLNAVLSHARNFHVQRNERRNFVKTLNGKILKEWEKSERRRQAEEQRNERDRLQMLREGDEEGYMRLLQKKKDARLDMLLQQTADFLDRIGSMVQLEKDRAAAEEAAEMGLIQKEDVEVVEKEGEQEKKQEGENVPGEGEQQQQHAGGGEGVVSVSAPAVAPIVPSSAPAAPAPSSAAPVKKPNYMDSKHSYYKIAHTVEEKVSLQPIMLRFGQLREYQLQGLQWLVSLYNNNLNGILADEMGLGKTIQTIAMVAYLMENKKNKGPYLVIVPLSTVSNWKDEFDRWAPEVQLIVYQGSPNHRKSLWTDRISTGQFNVLVTTFEFIIRDKNKLSRVNWNFCIVDEGHRMKNSESKLATVLTKHYHSKHRLLLTGTPLQNSLPELWALLNFLLPNIFNSVDSFENWFNAPFEASGEKAVLREEESLLIIRRLHQVLRPFLLRRLKKDVEKQLPDKMEKVIRCDQSAWQRLLYQRMLTDRTLVTEAGVKGLQNKLMQLRKICNHPYLFEEKATYEVNERMVRAAGKFVLLDQILPKLKATGHRCLIFSQMTQLMDIMGSYFALRGYQFLRLDGTTKQEDRREAMAAWNAPNSPYFCFMLSTRAGGLGLNLQTADTVILFDSDWNPQADLQASDRAHRIGQTKSVLVLRLITAHTIEEHILETAQRKLGMDQKIIGAGLFNQSGNEKASKVMLEEILRAEQNRDDQAEVHSAKEINKRLARTDEEYALFKQMDREREAAKEARRAAGETVPPDMLEHDELPDWLLKPGSVEVDADNMKFEQIAGVVSNAFGRGKRRKAVVDYSDQLGEDEFCELVEKGLNDEEIKKYIAERNERLRQEAQQQQEKEAQEAENGAEGGALEPATTPKRGGGGRSRSRGGGGGGSGRSRSRSRSAASGRNRPSKKRRGRGDDDDDGGDDGDDDDENDDEDDGVVANGENLDDDDDDGEQPASQSGSRRASRAPSSAVAISARDEELKAQCARIVHLIATLSDAKGRCLATNWRVINGDSGEPASASKNRRRSGSKPLDLSDIEKKVQSHQYKTLRMLTADLEKMLKFVSENASAGPQEKADAAEARRVLQQLSAVAASGGELTPVIAYSAVETAADDNAPQGAQPQLKKLKLKLSLPGPARGAGGSNGEQPQNGDQ